MQLFGTSGIRGVVDSNLIQLVLQVGLAVGKMYRSVVVGCDTRTSSNALKNAFISGLLAAGSSGYDAGVTPTPTLALAAREFDAGAMITASHNPPEYNGIKLLNPDGSAFDSIQQKRIEKVILDGSFSTARWDEVKSSSTYNGAIEQHIERIMRDSPNRLKLKVVIDCCCGAASLVTPYLLRRLGCNVIALHCYPSGFFPHGAEPTEANFRDLMRETRESGADLGIAHDGDGDRMMVVDDRGRFVPGDKLLALFAQKIGTKELVTTIDASMAIDEMGFKVTKTKVGDTHVSGELRRGGRFGGEPSGSWIFPNVSLCADGIYAAAIVATMAGQQKLSLVVDNMPYYPLLRGSIAGRGLVVSELEGQLLSMEPLSVSKVDGIKLNFEDGWLLVRASGTEPKVRITAEAKNKARVHQLYDSGIKAVKDYMKGK